MSKEAVAEMMQAAGQDSALQQRLTEAGGFDEVVQIGAEKGYDFTSEELQMVLAERGISVTETEGDELSDEALEAVAGGWFDNWRVDFRWGGW
jgi:predicted ribosomally synthesized peptide with nif11-like leader